MQIDTTEETASTLVARVRSGDLTVAAVTRAHLDRISRREPEVRAWAYLDTDLATAQAAQLDGTPATGPLHGAPVGIKDVFLTQDMPTRYNSPAYEAAAPAPDASVVALLRAAGAVILGKTTTVEFASTGRRAETRNPRDLRRSPGGSSSGSAAAVADGHVPLAIGTQTGGSMMRPASFCGVFALKPTWGLVSAEGAKVTSPSLDTVGWFARSVKDLTLVYDVFDSEPAPAAPLDLKGLRIAICRSPAWDAAEAATRQAMQAADERMRRAGIDVVPLDLPRSFSELAHCHKVIMECECRASFLAESRMHGAALHPSLLAYVDNASGHTRRDLRKAYDLAAEHRARFDALAEGYDAILTPSAVGEAHLGPQEVGTMVLNALWTLLHTPCVNVPGLVGPNNMPIGLTLTAPRFADRRLLAAAEAIAPLLPPR